MGWRVGMLLSESDLMEQPIQPPIALTVEPVAHAAGAGGFQRCNRPGRQVGIHPGEGLLVLVSFLWKVMPTSRG